MRGQPLTVHVHAVQAPEGPRPDQAVVLVLFGTEYGFSKEVAERLCSELGCLDDGLYWWALQLWLWQQRECCALSCNICAGRMMRAATCVGAAACCRMTQPIMMSCPPATTLCRHRARLARPHVVCHCESLRSAHSSDMPASIQDMAQPTFALLPATCRC